jgi:hypothetical protein
VRFHDARCKSALGADFKLWFCHMKICFLISGRHGVSPKRNEGVVSNASISGSRFGPGGKVTTVTGEEDVTDGCNCLCFHRSQTCVSSLVRGRVVGYRRCSVTSHASISRLHPHDARTTRGPSDPGLHMVIASLPPLWRRRGLLFSCGLKLHISKHTIANSGMDRPRQSSSLPPT